MGGGLGLAAACDLRICADDARFRMPAGRLGLGYSQTGVHRFVDLIGVQNTCDIFFSARVFDAAEALRMGFVGRVVPASELNEAVRTMARAIADNAPLRPQHLRRRSMPTFEILPKRTRRRAAGDRPLQREPGLSRRRARLRGEAQARVRAPLADRCRHTAATCPSNRAPRARWAMRRWTKGRFRRCPSLPRTHCSGWAWPGLSPVAAGSPNSWADGGNPLDHADVPRRAPAVASHDFERARDG